MRIDYLGQEVVSTDVQPISQPAVEGDSGANRLGQAVLLTGSHPPRFFDLTFELVAPRLCAEKSKLDLEILLRVKAQLLGDFGHIKRVRRRGSQRRRSEISHDRQLSSGIACPHGDHRCSDLVCPELVAVRAGE